MKIPTFPEIMLQPNKVQCRVRLKHEGVWYSTMAIEQVHGDVVTENDTNLMLNRFLHNVYQMILFQSVNVDLQFADGSNVWEKDDDQRDEPERILVCAQKELRPHFKLTLNIQ